MGSLGSYLDEESGDEREYESISAMFNEIVAHRIGMLPIPTDQKTIDAAVREPSVATGATPRDHYFIDSIDFLTKLSTNHMAVSHLFASKEII